MTTAGPEPGWCLDPDSGDNQRYWNGIEWTQHRRSRRPTVSQPSESFSHPMDIVDSMSESMLDGRPPATQERVIHMKKILGGIAAAIAMVLI